MYKDNNIDAITTPITKLSRSNSAIVSPLTSTNIKPTNITAASGMITGKHSINMEHNKNTVLLNQYFNLTNIKSPLYIRI